MSEEPESLQLEIKLHLMQHFHWAHYSTTSEADWHVRGERKRELKPFASIESHCLHPNVHFKHLQGSSEYKYESTESRECACFCPGISISNHSQAEAIMLESKSKLLSVLTWRAESNGAERCNGGRVSGLWWDEFSAWTLWWMQNTTGGERASCIVISFQ